MLARPRSYFNLRTLSRVAEPRRGQICNEGVDAMGSARERTDEGVPPSGRGAGHASRAGTSEALAGRGGVGDEGEEGRLRGGGPRQTSPGLMHLWQRQRLNTVGRPAVFDLTTLWAACERDAPV
jgi:hypothetical protein